MKTPSLEIETKVGVTLMIQTLQRYEISAYTLFY